MHLLVYGAASLLIVVCMSLRSVATFGLARTMFDKMAGGTVRLLIITYTPSVVVMPFLG